MNGIEFDPVMKKGSDEMISVVNGSSLATLVMIPFNGFVDAIDISIFVLVLGGFLGIVQSTGALEAGINALVKKRKGRDNFRK